MRMNISSGKVYRAGLGLGLIFIGLAIGKAPAFGTDKSNGCGIGWYFSKDKTLLASSLRNSSNSTSPNSFSMTSGTSGCAEHDIVENSRRTQHFVEANFDALRRDVVMGSGEYLTTLSGTLGCSWHVLPELSQTTRQHYDYLFKDQSPTESAATVGKLRHLLRAHPQLQQNCGGA